MTTGNVFEEAKTTKGEKLLAVVLTAFLLSGLIWAYVELKVEHHGGLNYPRTTSSQRQVLDRYENARFEVEDAQRRVESSERRVEEIREAYRTELDAGDKAADPKTSYEKAQSKRSGAQSKSRPRSDAPAPRPRRNRSSTGSMRQTRRPKTGSMLRIATTNESRSPSGWRLYCSCSPPAMG